MKRTRASASHPDPWAGFEPEQIAPESPDQAQALSAPAEPGPAPMVATESAQAIAMEPEPAHDEPAAACEPAQTPSVAAECEAVAETAALEAQPIPAMTSAAEPAAPATTSPAEQPVAVAKARVAQPPSPVRWKTPRRAIAAAAAALLVMAALAFPRLSSSPDPDDDEMLAQRAPTRAADVAPVAQQAAARMAPVAARVSAPTAAAPSKKTVAPKPAKNRGAESPKPGASIAAVTPIAEIPLKEDAPAKLPGFEAIPPPAPAAFSNVAGGIAPVTITGCLEVSVTHDEFRLTDTEGADAPKSRSWRTGFLKKRSAAVSLVEPPERLELQTHVGRRVAATGLLTSHDLKVSALRVVGSSCN